MIRILAALWLAFLPLPFVWSQGQVPGLAQAIPQRDPRLTPVTVKIECEKFDGKAGGSGTVAHVGNGKALVITAHHVIADGNGGVKLQYVSGKTTPGQVVRCENTGGDLAAIVADAVSGRYTPVARRAPSDAAELAQLGWTHGKGPFPRKGKTNGHKWGFVWLSFEVDGGDSGSGVFNENYELVAVVVRKAGDRFGPAPAICVPHARLLAFYELCMKELFPVK